MLSMKIFIELWGGIMPSKFQMPMTILISYCILVCFLIIEVSLSFCMMGDNSYEFYILDITQFSKWLRGVAKNISKCKYKREYTKL